MRIGILVYGQPAESEPEHFLSKDLAAKAFGYYRNGKKVLERVSAKVYRICVDMTFSKLKSLLRNFRDTAPRYAAGKAYIPAILPPAEVHGVTFDDPVNRAPGSLVFTRLWAERQEQHA